MRPVRRACCSFVWAALFSSAPARAEWLAGPSRAISNADSASPDAPITGYAYGPRAEVSLGGELALLSVRSSRSTFRLGGSALVVFEDARHRGVLPTETLRSAFELSFAWSLTEFATRTLGPGKELELSLALGQHSALPMTDFTLGDRYHSDDVPFGAGGAYLAGDAAFRTPLGQRFLAFSRLGLRCYTNAFPDLVGAHEASDFVADAWHEGAEYRAFFELGLRYRAAGVEPLGRWYFELIEPHDDSAKPLALTRLLLGAALPGTRFELIPFTALEAGHGAGIAVNRTELRLAVGVRLDAR